MAGASTPRGRQPVELNVTPLVDVMLVLLVVFMLSAPLTSSDIDVQLPSVSGAGATQPRDGPPPLVVEVDAKGGVRVDGIVVDGDLSAALASASATASATSTRPEIRVFADAQVPYQFVAGVLVEARAAGFDAVGLAVEAKTPGRSGTAP